MKLILFMVSRGEDKRGHAGGSCDIFLILIVINIFFLIFFFLIIADIVIPSFIIASLFIVNGLILAVILRYRNKRKQCLELESKELAEL